MGSESKCVAEREKTKLRERRRRSITSKILKGLRKHGGYDLRARADINDVLRALAAEAGWVVEPDGTTYRTAPKVSPSSSAEAGAQERSSNGGTPMPFAIGGGDGGGTESSTIAGAALGSLRAPPAGGLFLSPIRSFGGGFLFEDLCAGTAVEAWAWRQSSQKNV